MSIIYEALKKTQNSSKNITADITSNAGQEQNPRKAGKIPYLMPALVIVSGLGFIFFIILGKYQEIDKVSVVRKPEIKESVSRALSFDKYKNSPSIPSSSFSSLPFQGVPWEEKNPQRLQPDFVVNGIVISPDGNIALINDQIIRAGDNIEDAKVERIEDSRVVLSYHGREIVLKAK